MATTSSIATTLDPALIEQIEAFKADNPQLVQALELLAISSEHYEEAIRALYYAPTCVSASSSSPRR